jgi:predicted O-methyltransferase YrrM
MMHHEAHARTSQGLHRDHVLGRTLTRLTAMSLAELMEANAVLDDLAYGWGNASYAATAEMLRAVVRLAAATPGPILECGSGLTTLLLGLVADRTGNRVWTLEHLSDWGARLRQVLADARVGSVRLGVSPLRSYGAFAWYTPSLADMPRDFALVICDGPPSGTAGGRYGLMPVMHGHLRPGCVILLDDVHRPDEQKVFARWLSECNATPSPWPTRHVNTTARRFGLLTLPADGQRSPRQYYG